MTRSTSPRYQISYVSPTLRDEPADVPGDIKRLVDAIEVSAMYLQGPIASRPAAAIAGRIYFATNELILYYDDGAAWTTIGPPVPAQQVPAGTVMQYAGSAAPTGYLLCDGASYLVANYGALHAAIGYAYGGSGANFNVPNLKGRVPVGRDAAQGEFDVLGEAAGAKTHVLASGEMPVHAHSVSDPTHAHSVYDPTHGHSAWTDTQGQHGHTTASGSPFAVDAQINAAGVGTSRHSVAGEEGGTNQAGAHGHNVGIGGSGTGIGIYGAGTGIGIQNAGGGAAHNNLQPYVVLNYIIRTGLLA
jgi:microcystin-dependent protein